MDSFEARLDDLEAQRSTNVSHHQRKRRYFPMNLINRGACTRGSSQSGGDDATPQAADTGSVPEFLTNLRLSDLYDLPGEYVPMNAEIFTAMRAGDKEFVEKMKISYRTPMACFKDGKGHSILHIAAALGHLELVKRIVSESPSLLLESNWKDKLPLHVAARAGHLEVVEALVASVTFFSARLSEEGREGLNLYVVRDKNGNTALHSALKDFHQKKKLLMKNQRIRDRPSKFCLSKSTTFFDASKQVMETAVCLVKANQCASFLANFRDISPLYMAVEAGNVSIMKVMLNHPGYNVQGSTSNLASKLEGRKWLVHAALKSKNIDVLELILCEDPDLVNEKDEEGRTSLSFGASVGYYEGVCKLLDLSTSIVFKSDNDGFFPIHAATKYGHVKVLHEILQRCPNAFELHGKDSQNILHVAAENGQLKAIKFILRCYKAGNKEISINEPDVNGNTLLHLATINAHPKVVNMLTWDERVDVKIINRHGLTALDIAEKNKASSNRFLELLTWIPLVSAGTPRNLTTSTPDISGRGYKELVNTLLLVSTLVATMTFSAGFALPGGYNGSNPDLGMAALAKKRAFEVFLVFDTLAMYSSILTTVALIWAQVGDPCLIKKALYFALPVLGLSLTFMSIAFMAGTFAAVSHLPLLAYFILGIGLIFLVVFLLILIPYVSPKVSTNPFLRHIFYIPYFMLLWVAGDNKDNEYKNLGDGPVKKFVRRMNSESKNAADVAVVGR